MHHFIILFFILLFPLFSYTQSVQRAVLFGEHSAHVPTSTSNSYKVFMDMNGDYYPENAIADEELKGEGNAQLKTWAAKFPEKFSAIAKTYRLDATTYTLSNYQILQDSILQTIARAINVNGKGKRLVWLFHGFRKQVYNAEGIPRRSAYLDNKAVKNRIAGELDLAQNEANYFIELYWDGKHADFGFNLKSMIVLGKLFKKEAIPNAKQTGYALRKLFNLIPNDRMVLISHSTGTHIVAPLLFNMKKEHVLPTPANKDIRVALLASASAGKKTFRKYYSRNTNVAFQEKDNYSIMNVYNENDVVLRKRGFVKLFGNTALGCNFHNASGKLKKMFSNRYPNSTFLECSIGQGSGNHQFKAYVSSSNFSQAIAFLFK